MCYIEGDLQKFYKADVSSNDVSRRPKRTYLTGEYLQESQVRSTYSQPVCLYDQIHECERCDAM